MGPIRRGEGRLATPSPILVDIIADLFICIPLTDNIEFARRKEECKRRPACSTYAMKTFRASSPLQVVSPYEGIKDFIAPTPALFDPTFQRSNSTPLNAYKNNLLTRIVHISFVRQTRSRHHNAVHNRGVAHCWASLLRRRNSLKLRKHLWMKCWSLSLHLTTNGYMKYPLVLRTIREFRRYTGRIHDAVKTSFYDPSIQSN